MFKKIAIFSFILAAIFYFILYKGNQPIENVNEEKTANNEAQYLTQETVAVGELEPSQSEVLSLDEIQEKLDDISEQIDILTQEIKELSFLKQVAGAETELSFASSTELIGDEEEIDEEIIEEEEIEQDETEESEEIPIVQLPAQKLCQIEPGAFPERNKVMINELAWMGNTASADSEWFEIKNVFGAEISLSGWQIISGDGKIKIFFSKEDFLPAFAFYLLERTDDETLPGLASDKIYTGALKNDGGSLYLFNENCQLQDEVLAIFGWPFGDNNLKRTMERRGDFSWQTSANAGGTPKAENSAGFYEVFYPGGGGVVEIPPKPIYLKILISEIQIAGEESEKDDFIELYNPNYEDIDLTDWYLQRRTETGDKFSTYISNKQFAQKIIKSQSYFLAANASSSFSVFAQATTTNPLTENNTLVLKNPNGDIVDKVGFGNAQDFEGATTTNPGAGSSIGRKWSTTTETYVDTDNNYNDFEVQGPTPNLQNQSPAPLNQLPFAVFSFLPVDNPSINQEILFDASSSTDPDGAITMYGWDFGDNNYAAEIQATTTHSFATSSQFLITLFVTDNLGATSSLATATINIIPPSQPILEISTTTVLINEIAWMGNASPTDEWIEIYNNTNKDVDLAGWKLVAADGTPEINFNGSTTIISAGGFYLLERINDSTVPEIFADLIYTGALGNGGEKLELKDASGTLIDSIDCSYGWFAGDNKTKETMERINPALPGSDSGNWASSTTSGGTPRAKNSVSLP